MLSHDVVLTTTARQAIRLFAVEAESDLDRRLRSHEGTPTATEFRVAARLLRPSSGSTSPPMLGNQCCSPVERDRRHQKGHFRDHHHDHTGCVPGQSRRVTWTLSTPFPAISAALVAASDAIAFVIVLVLSERDEPRNGTNSEDHTSAWSELRAGVSYVAKTRWLLWTLLFGSSLALIIQGPIEVLLPFLARDRFTNPEATFGLLLPACGIGGAVGSLVISSLRLPRRCLTCMLAWWGGGTVPLVVVGVVDHLVAMLA